MDKKLVERILPKGRGNHASGAERERNGRKGRGVDAFSAKITSTQKEIDKRIEAIAARNPVNGYINVSFPLHVPLVTVKGVKF